MHVEMINWPWLDEEALCGTAAAVCTGSQDPGRSLARAIKSGHESVLEHAVYTYKVEGVSRALMAQMTRHRIASFSVQSQRHTDMSEMPVVVPESISGNADLMDEYADLMEDIKGFYRRAVAAGIPKEDARYVTPQAAKTEFLVTMNARELRHFFRLRCCEQAQWEIRALAWEMLRQARKVAPAIFDDAGPRCAECRETGTCGRKQRAE